MAVRWRVKERKVNLEPKEASVDELPLSISGRAEHSAVFEQVLLDSVTLTHSAVRRLSQLNALVRLRKNVGDPESHGIPFEKTLRYLSVGLCDACKQVRAATFRVIRHFANSRSHFKAIHAAHVDFYIARALDLSLDNEVERVQAMLLARKMLQLGELPCSVVNCLMALALEGGEERERLTRISLETLCEILTVCPEHPKAIPVLRVLMEFILSSSSVALSTAVVATVVHFAGKAENVFGAAEICDITQVLSPITGFEGSVEDLRGDAKAAKVLTIHAAKCAIVAALRTWEGLYLITSSATTGIQSLVGVLSLNNQSAQESVLDIIAQLLFLPKDLETSHATCDWWNLQENFVAAEARALLPHVGRSRLNLCANYLALLLFMLYQNGLVEGLASVITTGSKLHSRALYLLNSFVMLANTYLPAEFISQLQSLPTLISLATSMNAAGNRIQGADAIADLFRLSNERAERAGVPANMSLYLEHVLELTRPDRGLRLHQYQPVHHHHREWDVGWLRDSHVLLTNEHIGWDWKLITSLLKSKTVRSNDPMGYKFLHRLLVFYKPSNKLFSGILKRHELARCYAHCGCYFVEVLLLEARDLLEELLTDIHTCLTAVLREPNADVIFNPLKLSSSCACDYFLLLGRISSSEQGQALLIKTEILPLYYQIIGTTDIHESYVKLIVSTLDYRENLKNDGFIRRLLGKVLRDCTAPLRRYATLHLRTLLRARMPDFASWGMELLLWQLRDENPVVARTALKIIDEACDERANLIAFVTSSPAAILRREHLSPLGEFLASRIMGVPQALNALGEVRVQEEIDKWTTGGLNRRYAAQVEEMINCKLLANQSPDDVLYRQSSVHSGYVCLPELFLPEHLFGQLVQHLFGCELLRGEMVALVATIQSQSHDQSSLDVKAALWALGHIGRTVDGMAMLNEFDIINTVVKFVTEERNLSIRGTAYFVLGLWSTTEGGADLLKSREWLAVRHDRHELCPLADQRVTYIWQDAPPEQYKSNSLPDARSPKPSQMLSFTSAPGTEFRPQSPIFDLRANLDATVPVADTTAPFDHDAHKNGRGESGFESAGGHGVSDNLHDRTINSNAETRDERSESCITSDFSVGSCGSPCDFLEPSSPQRVRSSYILPDGAPMASSEPWRLNRIAFFLRTRRESHGSFDEVRPKRSDTRHSFRSLAKHAKFLIRQKSVNVAMPAPPHSPTPSLRQSTGSRSPSVRSPPEADVRSIGEASAKEEKYMGICLPMRRTGWHHELLKEKTRSGLLQPRKDDNACLHGHKTAHSVSSPTGLDIHIPVKCLVCSVVGEDLSVFSGILQQQLVNKRKEVLHFLEIFATPIGHKAAETGILQLKNQFPSSFLDPCLYSEVCHLLASYSYKLSIRRLIQELFLDVPLQQVLIRAFQAQLGRTAEEKLPQIDGVKDDVSQLKETTN